MLERGIFLHIGIGAAQMPDHGGIDRTQGVEVEIVETAQLLDGDETAGLGKAGVGDAPVGGAQKRFWRRRVERCVLLLDQLHHRLSGAVDQIGIGQPALDHERRGIAPEIFRVVLHELRSVFQIPGNADGVRPDDLAVLAQIGVGDIDAVADDGLGAVGKPLVEAAIQRNAGENREQHGRKQRHEAEQADDAHMQAGAGRLPLARAPQADELPGDDGDHRRDQHAVDQPDDDRDVAGGLDCGEAGEDEIGQQAGNEREDNQDQPGAEHARAGLILHVVGLVAIGGHRRRAGAAHRLAQSDLPSRQPPLEPPHRRDGFSPTSRASRSFARRRAARAEAAARPSCCDPACPGRSESSRKPIAPSRMTECKADSLHCERSDAIYSDRKLPRKAGFGAAFTDAA